MRPVRPRARPGDVRVRRFRPSDVGLFCDYFFRSPPAFLHGLGLLPFPPGEEKRRRARWAETFRLARQGKERIRVLTVLYRGRPVGIHPLTDLVESRSGVMHAHFFRPQDRGRGIGRISYVKAMSRYLREFGLREIRFQSPTHNPAPLRIKEVLGLRPVGTCVYKSPLVRAGLRARVFQVRRAELPAVARRVGVRVRAF